MINGQKQTSSFSSIGEAFSVCIEKYSSQSAVVCGEDSLTYLQLHLQSEALAAQLRAAGVKTGDLVGVCSERKVELPVALLGIVKAGAAYVPFDAAYPPSRLREMAGDAGIKILLGHNESLNSGSFEKISYEDFAKSGEYSSPVEVDREAIAYVMFTSGSSGKPKGVAVPHRAILRLVKNQNYCDLGPGEKILQHSPVAFDASTFEIWGALLNGGQLVILPEEANSLRDIGDAIRTYEITTMWLTAGLFHAIADERPDDLRPLKQLLTGGDIVSPSHSLKVLKACPGLKLINGYGPTENTTFTCCHHITEEQLQDGLPIPVGTPISGTEVQILDKNLEPVEEGQAGELCALGDGLALGYWKNEELTAQKFVKTASGDTLYRTGDLASLRKDGAINFLGRIDNQVKIRGFRIELGEIENAILDIEGIQQVSVVAEAGSDSSDKTLVAHYVSETKYTKEEFQSRLGKILPKHCIPAFYNQLDRIPLNPNGKVDRKTLPSFNEVISCRKENPVAPQSKSIQGIINQAFVEVLGIPHVPGNVNFFDLGASSLHIARVHEKVQSALDFEFPITEFFRFTTVNYLSEHLAEDGKPKSENRPDKVNDSKNDFIAIVGLAGRFPGAPDVETFWENLKAGRETISHFSAEELDFENATATGSDPDSTYVRSRGIVDQSDHFDARHFGVMPREAEELDPQHRLMLECAQTALENAGHDPDRFDGKIGVFCGSSQNSYLSNNLCRNRSWSQQFAAGYPTTNFNALLGNDKDFLPTRLAYKLNLKGPAMSVQCACSTSLVSVAQACESLRSGTCDAALAGGISLGHPQKRDYLYTPDGIASKDGHCRAFDENATGTVFGEGVGLVVLRRLDDALADGDNIVAVIRGFALNNDGADKAGFTAPSINGQSEVICEAQKAAGIEADSIGYIEAHGTGTPLGDPIEVAALNAAFQKTTDKKHFCKIGTAKTNVGHLDIAAGITGLIKTALTIQHGVIPPLLHFKNPNPKIDFKNSPFIPAADLSTWKSENGPRRAGVSAFGVGGTNVHMVLEESPAVPCTVVDCTEFSEYPKKEQSYIFPFSATDSDALKEQVSNLGKYAKSHPEVNLDSLAFTLQKGRRNYNCRTIVVANSPADLAEFAASHSGKSITPGNYNQVAFMFPGQGSQHPGMAKELYDQEPVFRFAFNQCAEIIRDETGIDLLALVFPADSDVETMAERLKNTGVAQPAIFSIEYSLAQQWKHWGINPACIVGHSIGEFAAACIAGVFTLCEALRLICLRGKLMADLPGGAMISVRASADEIAPFLSDGICLAAVNGASSCVIAGPNEAADEVEKSLEKAGLGAKRLHTSHAFHSSMMDPIVDTFETEVSKIKLCPPEIPILSTVTNRWMSPAEATNPHYWASHMRKPVMFFDTIRQIWELSDHLLLEVGPGTTLATFAGQNPDRKNAQPSLASLPHPTKRESHYDHIRSTLGSLWCHGLAINWDLVEERTGPSRRIPLPTYPFQRKRYWVEPELDDTEMLSNSTVTIAKKQEPDQPLATIQAAPAERGVATALGKILSELSGIDPSEIDGTASFLDLGFDSLLLTQVGKEVQDNFKVKVSLRQLIDGFASINELIDHLEENTEVNSFAGTASESGTREAESQPLEKPDTVSGPATVIDRAKTDVELTKSQKTHLDNLIRRYTEKTKGSKALTQRYRKFHADPRTASGFNRTWKEMVYQIVTVKSRGSRLIDVDGNEYIDILNGFGPGFLGHSTDFLVDAIDRQLHQGYEVGPQSLVAMEAAELFCEVTGNERTSFVCTGSEAVQAAMRLARTVTNRDKIVIFARDYHGNFDEVLVRGVNGGGTLKSLPSAPGIPRASAGNMIVLPYGTDESLEIIRGMADELAAVIVEPVQSRRPEFRPGEFIREVRNITLQSGTLFVFDEVVTGFRFGPRGAQDFYGVDADLCTYGKVIGGGMPLGVVSGKARYMDTFDGGMWGYGDDSFPEQPVTFFAGTFVRHPLAMASVKAMLQFFKTQTNHFWNQVNAKGEKLANSVDMFFKENNIPMEMPNCGSLMFVRLGENQKYGNLFFYHLREKGIFMLEGFPSYMTAAHSDKDIDYTIAAFKESAYEMQAGGFFEQSAAGKQFNGPSLFGPPHSGGDFAGRRESSLLQDYTLSATAALETGVRDGNAELSRWSSASKALPADELVGIEEPGKTDSFGKGTIPLTEGQIEMWLASQMNPEASATQVGSNFVHLQGDLDISVLQDAIRQGIGRHETFRSTIDVEGSGISLASSLDFEVPLLDLSELASNQREEQVNEILTREGARDFDLAKGPLFAFQLIKLASQEHLLVFTVQMIICDGWGYNLVLEDIGDIYSAKVTGKEPCLKTPLRMLDYIRWQEQQANTPEAEEAEAFWLEKFKTTPPPLELPTSRPRPPLRSSEGARESLRFSEEFHSEIKLAAKRMGSTSFAVLLAAYQTWIYRLSACEDLVVGIPFAGQSGAGMDALAGQCVHTLPVRCNIDREQSFSDLVKEAKESLFDIQEYWNYSFGELVQKLDLPRDSSRIPLVSVIFNVDPPMTGVKFEGCRHRIEASPRSYFQYDLGFNLVDEGGPLMVECDYNSNLFDASVIREWLHCYEALLKAAILDSDTEVSRLPMVGSEKSTLFINQINNTARDYPADPVHKLVSARALNTPDAVAVEFEETQLPYGVLEFKANQLANHLRNLGVERNTPVGIFVERSAEMVVGILGVLKAGACFVPLDPDSPRDRIGLILEDIEIPLLLTQAKLISRLPKTDAAMVCLDEDWNSISLDSGESPEADSQLDDLAYITYTSGSTAKPKGVEISHRALVNCLESFSLEPGITPDDVMPALANLTFDISVLEIFLPLMKGARVLVIPRSIAIDPDALIERIERYEVTVMQATASTWRMLFDAGWKGRKDLRVLCGGEELRADLAKALIDSCAEVWNVYGPTETTIWSTACRVKTGLVSLGHPIANTRIYLIDKNLQPVPFGVPGEVMIGGTGLSPGYHKDRDLTLKKFVDDPFSNIDGSRLFHTGDLARYHPTGELEFLGRSDRQVKIRGCRIELGEIETVLLDHPDVREAVVLAREDEPGNIQLVAYLIAKKDIEPDLRQMMRKKLPHPMQPSAIINLDRFPRTEHGKIDPISFPAPGQEHFNRGEEEYIAPRNKTEESLARIWSEILKLDKVGIDDGFFDLGGQSLQAVSLFNKIERDLGRKLPLATLFKYPTIRQIAKKLNSKNGESETWGSLVPIATGGKRPPLFLVHGAGGNVLLYQGLANCLRPDFPLYGLQSRGLDGQSEPLRSLEEIAALYVEEIREVQDKGPYYLGGYCMGGTIAYEMAQLLLSGGEKVNMLALLDTYEWTQVEKVSSMGMVKQKLGFHLKNLSKLRLKESPAYLASKLQVAKDGEMSALLKSIRDGIGFGDKKNMKVSVETTVQNANDEAAEAYHPKPYYGRLTLVKPRVNYNHYPDPKMGWGDLAVGGLDIVELPINPHAMLAEPYVELLAKELKLRIEEGMVMARDRTKITPHLTKEAICQ